jgi:hypothetical protein
MTDDSALRKLTMVASGKALASTNNEPTGKYCEYIPEYQEGSFVCFGTEGASYPSCGRYISHPSLKPTLAQLSCADKLSCCKYFQHFDRINSIFFLNIDFQNVEIVKTKC